jgi:hypothetical protein
VDEKLQEIKDYIKYRAGKIPDNIRWLIESYEEQQREIERLKFELEKSPTLNILGYKPHELNQCHFEEVEDIEPDLTLDET